jgi:hypothetical protein
LSARHELFAQGIAMGKTQRAAYVAAGYAARGAAADASASQLLSFPKVAARVAELKSAAATEAVVSTTRLIIEAASLQDEARDAQHFGAAVAALVSKAKLAGLLPAPPKPEVPLVDPSTLTDEQLATCERALLILKGEGDTGPERTLAELQKRIDYERKRYEETRRDRDYWRKENEQLEAKLRNCDAQIACLDKLVAGLDEKIAGMETRR